MPGTPGAVCHFNGTMVSDSQYRNCSLRPRIFLTAMASVSCLYALSCHTPMTDFILFLKRIHVPALLIELMVLIYRFIFILLDCAHAISISQRARLGNKDFKTSLRSFSALISSLFIRAVSRSSILYDAMESRCYDGVLNVLSEEQRPRKREICFIIFMSCQPLRSLADSLKGGSL